MTVHRRPVRFDFTAKAGPDTVLVYVHLRTNVSIEEMKSRSRRRKAVAARDLAVWLMQTHCHWLSASAIGRVFSRSHTFPLEVAGRYTGERRRHYG